MLRALLRDLHQVETWTESLPEGVRTNQYLKGYPQAISTVLRKEKTG